MAIEARIREELSQFMNRTGGDVLGVVVTRRDGLPVASVAPGVDSKLISALSALALGSLRRVGEELKIGAAKNVIAYFEGRILIMWPVKDLYIVALANPDSNLGLLMLELERLGQRLLETV